MALDQSVRRRPKTLAESGICFASAAILMMAAAIGIKWLMGLVF